MHITRILRHPSTYFQNVYVYASSWIRSTPQSSAESTECETDALTNQATTAGSC